MHSKYLETNNTVSIQGVLCRMVLMVNFFEFLKLIFFCFVVAICDLVHEEWGLYFTFLNC